MLSIRGSDFVCLDIRLLLMIHVAASGFAIRFEELIDMKLDVTLEDDAQQTAIDVAAACGNQEVLALFEKKN